MLKWIPHASSVFDTMRSDSALAMLADGIVLSTDLLALKPPHSWFRILVSLNLVFRIISAEDAAAVVLLREARFHLLQVQLRQLEEKTRFRDVVSDKVFIIQGPALPFNQTGTVIFARVVLTDDESGWFVGEITPLYGAALAIAQSHPAANAVERSANWVWAEAVYSEAVRIGCRRLRF